MDIDIVRKNNLFFVRNQNKSPFVMFFLTLNSLQVICCSNTQRGFGVISYMPSLFLPSSIPADTNTRYIVEGGRVAGGFVNQFIPASFNAQQTPLTHTHRSSAGIYEKAPVRAWA